MEKQVIFRCGAGGEVAVKGGEQRGAGMQERWRQGSSIQAFDFAGGSAPWRPPPHCFLLEGFPGNRHIQYRPLQASLRRCSSTAAKRSGGGAAEGPDSCSVARTAGEAELDPRGHGPALPASSVAVGAPRGQRKSPLPMSQPALTRSLKCKEQSWGNSFPFSAPCWALSGPHFDSAGGLACVGGWGN